MTVWRKDNGRWAASVTVHVGVHDTEDEAIAAVAKTWRSGEMAALKAWKDQQFGDNHGGYRTGTRRQE